MRACSLLSILTFALVAELIAQVGPPPSATALTDPSIPSGERAQIAESMRVSRLVGDSLWPGWNEIPLALLLVTSADEFLIGHPRPSDDFAQLGDNAQLGVAVFHRTAVFPPHFLASFPAVGGVPTIVVGTAEATGKGTTAWVLSVLHERFHQLQMSQPDYFDGVAALDLAHGDTTGQWMLDYPFPYEDPNVRGRYVDLASHLLRSLELAGTPDFANRLEAYHSARERFRETLSEEDYRYFQFQLWQEGVARYTELRLAELAALQGEPPDPPPGQEPYAEAAARLRREILEGLQMSTLSNDRRVAFYPLGAATALLLDLVAPQWHSRYFEDPFALDPYFEPD
jgi:hypothetical protein